MNGDDAFPNDVANQWYLNTGAVLARCGGGGDGKTSDGVRICFMSRCAHVFSRHLSRKRAQCLAKRLLDKTWAMRQGRYRRDYNHEQSAMRFVLDTWSSSRAADSAHERHLVVLYAPEEQLQIHNAIHPKGGWKPGHFAVHYYGGMQGCAGECAPEFVTRCRDAAAAVGVDHGMDDTWSTVENMAKIWCKGGGEGCGGSLEKVSQTSAAAATAAAAASFSSFSSRHPEGVNEVTLRQLLDNPAAAVARLLTRPPSEHGPAGEVELKLRTVYTALHVLLHETKTLPYDREFGAPRGTPLDRFLMEHWFALSAAKIASMGARGVCLEFGEPWHWYTYRFLHSVCEDTAWWCVDTVYTACHCVVLYWIHCMCARLGVIHSTAQSRLTLCVCHQGVRRSAHRSTRRRVQRNAIDKNVGLERRRVEPYVLRRKHS